MKQNRPKIGQALTFRAILNYSGHTASSTTLKQLGIASTPRAEVSGENLLDGLASSRALRGEESHRRRKVLCPERAQLFPAAAYHIIPPPMGCVGFNTIWLSRENPVLFFCFGSHRSHPYGRGTSYYNKPKYVFQLLRPIYANGNAKFNFFFLNILL